MIGALAISAANVAKDPVPVLRIPAVGDPGLLPTAKLKP